MHNNVVYVWRRFVTTELGSFEDRRIGTDSGCAVRQRAEERFVVSLLTNNTSKAVGGYECVINSSYTRWHAIWVYRWGVRLTRLIVCVVKITPLLLLLPSTSSHTQCPWRFVIFILRAGLSYTQIFAPCVLWLKVEIVRVARHDNTKTIHGWTFFFYICSFFSGSLSTFFHVSWVFRQLPQRTKYLFSQWLLGVTFLFLCFCCARPSTSIWPEYQFYIRGILWNEKSL